MRFLWICLGGALGTGARYGVATWAVRVMGTGFPYGTLAVNVTGSFLIGAIMHWGLTSPAASTTVRLALTAGVLGGFTTYSSFSYESLRLLEQGAWHLALVNIALTLSTCLFACFLGVRLAAAIL